MSSPTVPETTITGTSTPESSTIVSTSGARRRGSMKSVTTTSQVRTARAARSAARGGEGRAGAKPPVPGAAGARPEPRLDLLAGRAAAEDDAADGLAAAAT